MRSPCDTTSSQLRSVAPLRVAAVRNSGGNDGLAAVDGLLATFARQREAQAAHAKSVLRDQHRFTHAAAGTFERVVRPAFEEIAERLNSHGGGGVVEERPAEGRHGQRLTLWMSLEGPVVVPPGQDRNPYIRLDVDMPWRRITVWEGDMWDKQGASRLTEPFTLDGLTTQSVVQRAVGVLRRAVNRGCVAEGEAQ
jgi:hypothetical protein